MVNVYRLYTSKYSCSGFSSQSLIKYMDEASTSMGLRPDTDITDSIPRIAMAGLIDDRSLGRPSKNRQISPQIWVFEANLCFKFLGILGQIFALQIAVHYLITISNCYKRL